MSDRAPNPWVPPDVLPMERCPICRCRIEAACYPQAWPLEPGAVVRVCGRCWEQAVNDTAAASDRIIAVVEKWRAIDAALAAYRSEHADVL